MKNNKKKKKKNITKIVREQNIRKINSVLFLAKSSFLHTNPYSHQPLYNTLCICTIQIWAMWCAMYTIQLYSVFGDFLIFMACISDLETKYMLYTYTYVMHVKHSQCLYRLLFVHILYLHLILVCFRTIALAATSTKSYTYLKCIWEYVCMCQRFFLSKTLFFRYLMVRDVCFFFLFFWCTLTLTFSLANSTVVTVWYRLLLLLLDVRRICVIFSPCFFFVSC